MGFRKKFEKKNGILAIFLHAISNIIDKFKSHFYSSNLKWKTVIFGEWKNVHSNSIKHVGPRILSPSTGLLMK